MKLLFLILFTFPFLFISCKEEQPNTPIEKAKHGNYYFQSNPDSAEIWVNDVFSDKVTPDVISASAGIKKIRLTRTDYHDTTFAVVFEDEKYVIHPTLNLKKIYRTGSIFFSSNPSGAQIWVDGIYSYKITPDSVVRENGTKTISIKKNNYRDVSFPVNFDEGQTINHPLVVLTEIGSIFFSSDPSGAQIWVDGINSNKITPDSVVRENGTKIILLKKNNYRDTIFTVNFEEGQTKIHPQVVLTENHANPTPFGPVKIWETVGSDATQPAGLILKNGTASGIGSTAANRLLVDLFYNTSGYDIVSASISSSLTRVTYFKAAGAANLNDGADAPAKDVSWTTSITNDRDNSQYYWVFDADGHYSKIKIVNYGTTVFLGWIEIQWLYNPIPGDRRF